jgi:hypothetical protein
MVLVLARLKEMCDICIEVDGGDGDSILASAQVEVAALRCRWVVKVLTPMPLPGDAFI